MDNHKLDALGRTPEQAKSDRDLMFKALEEADEEAIKKILEILKQYQLDIATEDTKGDTKEV